MKKILLISLLFIICNTGYSQLKPLTKKELKTLIRQGIATNENYSWEICIDNLSSKTDTLYAYSPHLLDCSSFITWHFKKNDIINQTTTKRKIYTTSSGWREYTFESTPVSPSNVYKIKFTHKQDKLILNRYNKGKLIDSYEVLTSKETPYNNIKSYIITLVRQ